MIVLDDLETWEKRLIGFLEDNKAIIFGYLAERSDIERKNTDLMFRYGIRRVENRFKQEWEEILSKVNMLIADSLIIGFHCSRLTEREIDSILRNGLEVLDETLLIKRIERLRKENLISDRCARELLNNNDVDECNRKGKLWFFHCKAALKDQGGLYRLFRRWGVEALYRKHEKDSMCNEELKRIGLPCIVLGLLSPQDVDNHNFETLAEGMIEIWKESYKDKPAIQNLETAVERRVNVFRVISIKDPLFYELTDFRNWTKTIE